MEDPGRSLSATAARLIETILTPSPVREIPSVIHALTSGPPSSLPVTISRYFLPTASFTHPFCRTGSFQNPSTNSRSLITYIYRWYRTMSPEIRDVRILSIAFDKQHNELFVRLQQTFAIRALLGHEARVELVVVLGLQKGNGDGVSDHLYYIRSQHDLYPPDQLAHFLYGGWIASYFILLIQYIATLICVLSTYIFAPVTWLEQSRTRVQRKATRGIQDAQRAANKGLRDAQSIANRGLQDVQAVANRKLQDVQEVANSKLQDVQKVAQQGLQDGAQRLQDVQAAASKGLQDAQSIATQGLQDGAQKLKGVVDATGISGSATQSEPRQEPEFTMKRGAVGTQDTATTTSSEPTAFSSSFVELPPGSGRFVTAPLSHNIEHSGSHHSESHGVASARSFHPTAAEASFIEAPPGSGNYVTAPTGHTIEHSGIHHSETLTHGAGLGANVGENVGGRDAGVEQLAGQGIDDGAEPTAFTSGFVEMPPGSGHYVTAPKSHSIEH